MTKTGGCGCGGKKPGCVCKGAAKSTGTDIASACVPCDEAAFVRPQFFAGQLLTEDDLTALETYIIGKNRLHNAKLFGDGVVCGLDVTCGPCDGTTVRVAPGYALDCCGNDLVLTCDREIDLRPLIIALREQKQGKGDCGDPCAPVAPTKTAAGSASTAVKSPVFEYCLYHRYDEASSDPIAGYPSPDDCAVSCQPTRVREGVSFELRCPEQSMRDDLVTHLEACLGRLSSPDRVTADGRSLDVAANQVKRAMVLMSRPADSVFTIDDTETQRWTDAQPELERIALHAGSKTYDPTGPELVAWTELLVDVGGIYLRLQAAGGKEMAIAVGRASPAAAAIAYIVTQLSDGTQVGKITSLLDRTTATEAATMMTNLTGQKTVAMLARPAADVIANLSYSTKLYLLGGLYTTNLRASYIAAAQDLRGKLLQALGCDGGDTADCTLYDDVRTLSLPSTQPNPQDVEMADAVDLSNFGRKLGGYVRRFFMDCICRAFNPPCRSCDDTAVLLACIKVRDCHVIEVCNMARTFVLSPAAMRYWMPPISWLGDLLAKLCCGTSCSEDLTKAGTDPKARFVSEMVRNPSVSSAGLMLPAFYQSGAYLPSLTSAASSFSDLAVRRLLPGAEHLRVPLFENMSRLARTDEGNEYETLRKQVTDLQARMDAQDAKAKGAKQ
jgi:hypothetical protein